MPVETPRPEESKRRRARTRLEVGRSLTSGERVASVLSDAIRRGELRAGQQVNQQRWAERLEVSRAALREGLKVVATQNLLTHDPNRGYFVTTLTSRDVSQLYWLRVLVEREVLLSIRRPSEAEADQIRDAAERAIEEMERRDIVACFDAEREMFFDIYALSPLDFLASEAERLWDLAAVFRIPFALDRLAHTVPAGGYEDRKRRQVASVCLPDPYGLAESVVLERRIVADRFLEGEFHWHAGGSVGLQAPRT